jgi:predicted nucleic acid-binding protein
VTCLLDVNLLMALLWENHEHHAKVRSWFKGVSSFATCPVANSALRGFPRIRCLVTA